jgi:hypothetical protein
MKGLKAFRVEDEPVEWGADEAPKKPRAPQPASANLTRDEARCLAEKFAKTPSVMAQRRKGWHVMPSPVAQSTDGSAPRTAATAAQQGIIERVSRGCGLGPGATMVLRRPLYMFRAFVPRNCDLLQKSTSGAGASLTRPPAMVHRA